MPTINFFSENENQVMCNIIKNICNTAESFLNVTNIQKQLFY